MHANRYPRTRRTLKWQIAGRQFRGGTHVTVLYRCMFQLTRTKIIHLLPEIL